MPVLEKYKEKLTEILQGNRKNLILVLVSILILLSYHLIFFRFFPNRYGLTGEDFSLFLPRLLDGYIWAKNNSILQVPWFTPSFCGGEPAYPDPQNIYFTLTQLLTTFFNPLQSIYFTVVLMTIAGYTGIYFLLRTVFRTSASTAILGSTLFLFNGFFIYRIVQGAIVYHALMLLPWMLYFAFKGSVRNRPHFINPLVLNGIMVGLIAAYWVYSGMVNILLPLGFSILLILLGLARSGKLDARSIKTMAIGFVVFLLVSASKMSAEFYYLGNFDRAFYPLPGTKSLLTGIYLTFRTLFFPSTHSDMQFYLVNRVWGLGRHEFEFGVTFVPLIIFLTYFVNKIIVAARSGFEITRPGFRFYINFAIVVILLIPVALNYYQPDWNRFLKSLPVLKNSSTLIRFNVMYILPVVILSSVLLEKLVRPGLGKIMLSGACVATVILVNATTDKSFYDKGYFDPKGIDTAYNRIKQSGKIPTIHAVGNIESTAHFADRSLVFSDFTLGISRLRCYEPMFGYRLEALPMKTLHPGPVGDVTNDRLNIKNPACYVFPKENSCEPGDHFKVSQKTEAGLFTSYRPFQFNLPIRQVVLNYVSVFSVLGCMLILIVAVIERVIPHPVSKKG
ncbi:MAG: hypothetical protein ACWGOV_02240 [Acidiferrobacterales bacterium]